MARPAPSLGGGGPQRTIPPPPGIAPTAEATPGLPHVRFILEIAESPQGPWVAARMEAVPRENRSEDDDLDLYITEIKDLREGRQRFFRILLHGLGVGKHFLAFVEVDGRPVFHMGPCHIVRSGQLCVVPGHSSLSPGAGGHVQKQERPFILRRVAVTQEEEELSAEADLGSLGKIDVSIRESILVRTAQAKLSETAFAPAAAAASAPPVAVPKVPEKKAKRSNVSLSVGAAASSVLPDAPTACVDIRPGRLLSHFRVQLFADVAMIQARLRYNLEMPRLSAPAVPDARPLPNWQAWNGAEVERFFNEVGELAGAGIGSILRRAGVVGSSMSSLSMHNLGSTYGVADPRMKKLVLMKAMELM